MTISKAHKSTTVRSASPVPLAPIWLRKPMGHLSQWSPKHAAWLAEKLMVRTQRFPMRDEEEGLLESGRSLELAGLGAWEWGQGPKTALLIHGWNGRATQLGALVPSLVDAGYRVASFDWVGHGQSDGSVAKMSDVVAGIRRVADVVGPLELVVAHSAGCAMAILAMREGLPVKRLACIAPPLGPESYLGDFSRAFELSEKVQKKLQGRMEKRMGGSFAEFRLSRMVEQLGIPVFVAHDREDRWIPAQAGQELASAAKWGEYMETQGLGHHRILRDEEVGARIVEFAQRNFDSQWKGKD